MAGIAWRLRVWKDANIPLSETTLGTICFRKPRKWHHQDATQQRHRESAPPRSAGGRHVSPSRQASPIGTEGATRVADVLLLFLGDADELGVTQISRELQVSKAVVHRVLQSMVARGLLSQDPERRTYRLGAASVSIGARALRDSDLRSVAEPILRKLRDETNETTTLSQYFGAERTYVAQFPSPQEIKMLVEIGR